MIENVSFRPSVGLDGFKVVSTLNIETLECKDLKNEVYQLGLLLYPPELMNEKFLIKLRDCVLKLPENNPLKKWLRWVSLERSIEDHDKDQYSFMIDIANSPFNLITDAKMKMRISKTLLQMPEETLSEILLKSYFYLMIGNVTRSDKLLKKFIEVPPRFNWEKGEGSSLAHRVGKEVVAQLLEKLSRHPADRKVFQLFIIYLQNYYNEKSLLALSDSVNTKEVESKISLKAVEQISPELVTFIRISSLKEDQRSSSVTKNPQKMQAYWIWPFLDIDPFPSSDILTLLQNIEKEDQLWYIYVVSDDIISEKLAKQSINTFLPKNRGMLKNMLKEPGKFMMALYQLIELGDIGFEIVEKTTEHVTHE